jgi:metal-responsive CopG/Arc/MetJ family transcriptional regulator
MHTITLKTDDNFFAMLNELVATLGITRSNLIRNAVVSYKENLEKEQLKQQIQKASMKVRNESKTVAVDFEESLSDGLDNG